MEAIGVVPLEELPMGLFEMVSESACADLYLCAELPGIRQSVVDG
jgi:hypothetical protein